MKYEANMLYIKKFIQRWSKYKLVFFVFISQLFSHHLMIYMPFIDIQWYFILLTVKRADESFSGVLTEMSPMWTDIKNAHNALHQHPVRGFRRLSVSLG